MTRDEALEKAGAAFDRLNRECADIDTVELADRHVVSVIADLLLAVDAAARAEERELRILEKDCRHCRARGECGVRAVQRSGDCDGTKG